VEYGELASGLVGSGRMAEPETITAFLESFLTRNLKKKENKVGGRRALVTAGPTHEAIDPVRFIGNHSSGKMGIALARVLAQKGFEVDLVLGPVGQYPLPEQGILLHKVTSAAEMFAVCAALFKDADLAILTAAVADFRPRDVATQKIKKGIDTVLPIDLVK